jgi:hypothetical protein
MTRSRDLADTQDNLGGAVAPFVAGKNKIINGDMAIAQRSTSASGISTNDIYYAIDRYKTAISGTGLNITISRDTSVPNVAFSYSQKLQQISTNATSVSQFAVAQSIETSQVSGLYGKTATISFWYRSNITGNHYIRIYTGSQTGGVDNSTAFNITTANTWQYVTVTTSNFANITAIANYSFGAQLDIGIRTYQGGSSITVSANDYFQFTGFQLEAGSVATPFTTASGSIGGELALCQRYFERLNSTSGTNFNPFGTGQCGTTTIGYATIYYILKRTSPSFSFSTTADFALTIANGNAVGCTAISSVASGLNSALIQGTVASGLVAGNATILYRNSSASAYIDISAEL